MKVRKILALALVSAVLGMLLVACADNGVEDGAFSAENPAHITYYSLAWILAEQNETRRVIDEWNSMRPDIQVEYIQGDWGTVDQYLLTAFETGDVPDIFHYWAAPILVWRDRGFLADLAPMLTDEMRNDVIQDIWDLFTSVEGYITALPFQKEVQMLFYNVDMFAAADITAPTPDNPWTLDQLIEYGRLLTDESQHITGLGLQGMGWLARYFNDNWATMAGLSPVVVADPFEVSIDGAYRDLLDGIISLADEGVIHPDSFAGGIAMNDLFMTGQMAILQTGNWVRSVFINEFADSDINWGMLPGVRIDTAETYGAIQTLSIPTRSNNQIAAMEFLEFYWNVDNQESIAGSAFIFPGRRSAIERFNIPEHGWDMAYETAMSLVIPDFIATPGWGSFVEGLGRTLYQEYALGQITFEEFERRMIEQMLPILEEARAIREG